MAASLWLSLNPCTASKQIWRWAAHCFSPPGYFLEGLPFLTGSTSWNPFMRRGSTSVSSYISSSEVCIIYNQMCSWEVCSLMSLDEFIHQFNPYHNQDPKFVHHPQKVPFPLNLQPTLQPQATINLLTGTISWLFFLEHPMKGIILSLSTFLRFPHVISIVHSILLHNLNMS